MQYKPKAARRTYNTYSNEFGRTVTACMVQVRYESRRRLAETRPRVRGQFVKAGTAASQSIAAQVCFSHSIQLHNATWRTHFSPLEEYFISETCCHPVDWVNIHSCHQIYM